jgi:hypothetical protein
VLNVLRKLSIIYLNKQNLLRNRTVEKINVEELKQYFFGNLPLPAQVQEKPVIVVAAQK